MPAPIETRREREPRMDLTDWLLTSCGPDAATSTYYRPVLLGPGYRTNGVMVMGANPATPITTDDCNLKDYVTLLQDRAEFEEFMGNLRENQGASRSSKTRERYTCMRKILNDVRSALGDDIAEANACAFPTPRYVELQKYPGQKSLGDGCSKALIQLLNPKVIIAHGKHTWSELSRLLGPAVPKEGLTFKALLEKAGKPQIVAANWPGGAVEVAVYCYPHLGTRSHVVDDWLEYHLKKHGPEIAGMVG